jgi:hypothetical protein
MRTVVVAAGLVIAALGTASAQSVEPKPPTAGSGGGARHGAAGAPRPSVNPAPPKTAPTPPVPPPLPTPPVPAAPGASESPFAAGPFTYAPRYRPFQRPRSPYYWASGYFGYAPYEGPSQAAPDDTPRASEDQLSGNGGLDLEIEPRTADVYVDGFYVGTADDVASNGLALRAGPHWVDVRAPGYDTLTMQVSIIAGQAVRFRRELALATAREPVSRPPEGSQTIYVIPGCYAGNRPPNESALPTGCDIANLRVKRQ